MSLTTLLALSLLFSKRGQVPGAAPAPSAVMKRNLIIAHGTPQGPPTGKSWLVLGGWMEHTTGTTSAFQIRDRATSTTRQIVRKLAADATVNCPIFNTQADDDQAQFTTWIVEDTEYLQFSGVDATKHAYVSVLEF